MGWFDESDEEECFNNNTSIPKKNPSDQEDDDQEEDPLDTFMSGIDKQIKNLKQSKGQSERMDVENEEEATSHWHRGDAKHFHTNTWKDPDLDQADHHDRTCIDEAVTSFHASFQKAGSSSVRARENKTSPTDADTEPDDDDGQIELREKHRHIEPLDICNHDSKLYPPFRRKFFHPNNTEEGRSWRSDYDVSCSVDDVDPIFSFTELGTCSNDNQSTILPQSILEYLETNGYKEPTLVQSQCIPLALSGKDLLVTSHTGSGKTLSYIIPLLVHILDQPHIQPGVDGPIALILTPTRELTKQVFFICKKMLKLVDAVAYAVTGGVGTYEMTKDLKKGCEVVISTPGRWIDMIKKKASNLDRTTLVVLDEADKMLDMGFETQVASILNNVRPDRQSWMFSATMGRKVERVAKRWLRDPIR
jgi:ATP-dependent RNA helicase DDX42